ncbi:MAG: bifunctional homocysteine S-methyltransferase/methylenetetrahydrofolate reductase [Myxococcota bacterium]|nr:bifunctional homocysteine S-methyltransferase/methylenetetrahydrofolate reductase [Myxococcota bacterium]
MTENFLDALDQRPIVVDGAMGTQLYERGIFINRSLEETVLSQPALVQRVHEEYVAAGAEMLQTHTFAANRSKLQRHGLENHLEELNVRAVELARAAGGQSVWVAGTIGPSGKAPGVLSDEELEEIEQGFIEQANILLGCDVDVLVLETFRFLSEMKLALKALRKLTKKPIVAQLAFDAEQRSADGADPERATRLLASWGADVVGANCVEGPGGVYNVVERMVGLGARISASPNAGYPRRQDDRLIYMANPEYFGVFARRFFKLGVRLVGGCCGTSPEHIRRAADAARMMTGADTRPRQNLQITVQERTPVGLEPVPVDDRTPLAAKVQRVYRERVKGNQRAPTSPEDFVVSVEVNPPPGLIPTKAINAARMLRDHGVDVINIADGPRASVRMSNQALALLVRQELEMDSILHVCARDRNLLGLQSDLLADHVLGLRNLVMITGDPPKLGDYPHATAVFDLDSIGLLRMVEGLNRGVDPAGREIGKRTQFFAACGAEPAALDYDRELRRLEEKIEHGAALVMTQPVYDPSILERFLDDTAHLDVPILVGLLPLASHRNAEFLHNEVPGMKIPEAIRERMKQADKGPAARALGVKIAQEALASVVHRVVGAYIMPPFGRYQAALEILEPYGYEVPA